MEEFSHGNFVADRSVNSDFRLTQYFCSCPGPLFLHFWARAKFAYKYVGNVPAYIRVFKTPKMPHPQRNPLLYYLTGRTRIYILNYKKQMKMKEKK